MMVIDGDVDYEIISHSLLLHDFLYDFHTLNVEKLNSSRHAQSHTSFKHNTLSFLLWNIYRRHLEISLHDEQYPKLLREYSGTTNRKISLTSINPDNNFFFQENACSSRDIVKWHVVC